MIFGLAPPAINILIKHSGIACVQIGNDEARVDPVRANFDAGNDALDAALAIGAVVKLLKAAQLAFLGCSLEAGFRAGLKALDVAAQCRGRRHAQNEAKTVGPAPVEHLGTTIMTVGAQHDLGPGPVGADRPQQRAQKGPDLLAAGRPFGGTKHGGDEAALAVEQTIG